MLKVVSYHCQICLLKEINNSIIEIGVTCKTKKLHNKLILVHQQYAVV